MIDLERFRPLLNLRIFSAVSSLALASFISAGSAFLASMILARSLRPANFGELYAAFGVISLITPLVGFGLAQFWLRVFGLEGNAAVRWLWPSFRFASYGAVLGLLILIFWVTFAAASPLSATLILVLAPLIFSQSMVSLVIARYQIAEKYHIAAFWLCSQNLIKLAAAVTSAVLLTNLSTPILPAILIAAASLFLLTLGGISLKRFYHSLSENTKHETRVVNAIHTADLGATIGRVLRGSSPYGFAGLLYIIYYQSDVIVLRYLAGAESAGHYQSAALIIGATYLLPSVVFQKYLLPKIHRWMHSSQSKIATLTRLGGTAMFLLGVAVALALILVAELLVRSIFGESYLAASVALKVLAFAVPFKYLSSALGGILSASSLVWWKVSLMFITAILNVALNLVWIPQHGLLGAAVATVISEGLVAVGFMLIIIKREREAQKTLPQESMS